MSKQLQGLRFDLNTCHPEVVALLDGCQIRISGRRGREYVLELPFGTVNLDISIAERQYGTGRPDGVAQLRAVNMADLRSHFDHLCRFLGAGSSGHVLVRAAGAGPTPRSRKVHVSGVVHEDKSQPVPGGRVTREHTLTVPCSQVVEVDGQLYAPRWLLKRTVHERILDKKSWPLEIEGGVYLDRDRLWSSVFAPAAAVLEKREAAAARQRATDDECRQKERAAAQAREQELEVLRQQQAERARATAAKALESKLRLPAVRAATVEWDGWVKRRNNGSVRRERITGSAENCTLRFSGARVYIQFDDGSEIQKAAKNVRYVAAETAEEGASEAGLGTSTL